MNCDRDLGVIDVLGGTPLPFLRKWWKHRSLEARRWYVWETGELVEFRVGTRGRERVNRHRDSVPRPSLSQHTINVTECQLIIEEYPIRKEEWHSKMGNGKPLTDYSS